MGQLSLGLGLIAAPGVDGRGPRHGTRKSVGGLGGWEGGASPLEVVLELPDLTLQGERLAGRTWKVCSAWQNCP